MTNDWITYEAEGDNYIRVNQWGRDHWSTLAYIETREVDHKGKIDNHHMRTNPRLHRDLCANVGKGGKLYPTRLKEGEQEEHDDWSCVEDMVAAGLVVATFKQVNQQAFNNSVAMVKLTEKGRDIANQLRQHKAEGGTFAQFCPAMVTA